MAYFLPNDRAILQKKTYYNVIKIHIIIQIFLKRPQRCHLLKTLVSFHEVRHVLVQAVGLS